MRFGGGLYVKGILVLNQNSFKFVGWFLVWDNLEIHAEVIPY